MGDLPEILSRIMTKTELLVDLAYSLMLYRPKEVISDVLEIEAQVDEEFAKLFSEILKEYKEGKINEDEAYAYLTLARSLENIADAGYSVSKAILRGYVPHPIMKMIIEESETAITVLYIPMGSKAVGKTIGELIEKYGRGVEVVAIRTKDDWIYLPSKDTKVEEGDMLIVKGSEESLDLFTQAIGAEDLTEEYTD